LRDVLERWFERFSEVLSGDTTQSLKSLLSEDCYWRDLLTFDWTFTTVHSPAEIVAWLGKRRSMACVSDLCLADLPMLRSLGTFCSRTLESFFAFETQLGHCRGYVRLNADPDSPEFGRAVTILTAMTELRAYPESTKLNRPRQKSMVYPAEPDADTLIPPELQDPQVVIVGGGQSGLMIAARLRQLGVDVLIIEQSERISDVWRKRYKSLKLHNELCMNHFPYLPYPESWPVYIPRDKIVQWLEFYAESMELNIATSTTFLSGVFDECAGKWTVRLRKSDGQEFELHPSHVIVAAGVSGYPDIPRIPGRATFTGRALHSSEGTDDLDVQGKKVLVVGAGTSAHDIAQMSYMNGADVTLLQRSSITVVGLEPASARPFEIYRSNDGVKSVDDVDLMASAVPYDLIRRLQGPLSKLMMEDDKELLAGLRKVGFLLDNGEDDTGYLMKLLRYQAGYYLNIGASDLIVAGKIKLKAGVGLDRFDGANVVFSDGTRMQPDIVIFATGYRPMQETVAHLFGEDVARRVGPIWGIGADGETQGMYKRTGQPGLYTIGGGFSGARIYSRYMAILIKAEIEGLLPFAAPWEADPGFRLPNFAKTIAGESQYA
jgi:putative flavoprotein involved in K+ transport